jgi:hypothetical protein
VNIYLRTIHTTQRKYGFGYCTLLSSGAVFGYDGGSCCRRFRRCRRRRSLFFFSLYPFTTASSVSSPLSRDDAGRCQGDNKASSAPYGSSGPFASGVLVVGGEQPWWRRRRAGRGAPTLAAASAAVLVHVRAEREPRGTAGTWLSRLQNYCFRLLMRPRRCFIHGFSGGVRGGLSSSFHVGTAAQQLADAASRQLDGQPEAGECGAANGQAIVLTLDLLPFLRPRSWVPSFFRSSICAPPPVSSPRPSRRCRPVLGSPPRLWGLRRPQCSAPRRTAATRALLRS